MQTATTKLGNNNITHSNCELVYTSDSVVERNKRVVGFWLSKLADAIQRKPTSPTTPLLLAVGNKYYFKK